MENLGSAQDELYYTAKNFNKLKFSNKAYIDSTQKAKEDNQREIQKLKKEYEKQKNEVAMLKKTSLYIPGRVKSANNSEYTFYRLKLDQARSEKLKSKEEWKKNTEKYNELKNEAKLISDDNNPYVKRIKLLENKLDKAMIKYNEAMSIRRTYEQILTRLKEERAGYDNQIAAIQKSLKAKGHDLSEFKLLLQDSKQAKNNSQKLVSNTKMSQKQFEKHFEQLIQAQQNENRKEMRNEKNEAKKRKQKLNDSLPEIVDDKMVVNKDNDLERKVKELEEADKLIRETTGADDINEICQKFSNLRETKENLKNEKKELEKMCDSLTKKKEELSKELNRLKYQSQDEITRKEIEDHERTAEKTLNACDASRQKLKKEEKLIVDLRSGIETLVTILQDKLFENVFNEDLIKSDNDISIKDEYTFVVKNGENKIELKNTLSKMNELFKVLMQRVNYIKDSYHFDAEENKLDRKEENEIENLYIEQKVESNENSEYGPEEDIDPELPNKDQGMRNDFDNALRPYSAINKKSKYYVNARDKTKY